MKVCDYRKFHRPKDLICIDCGKTLSEQEALVNNTDADAFDKYGIYPDECWECGGRPCKGCWA